MLKVEITPMSLEEAKEMGIDTWGRWGCEPSRFDWSYPEREVCYIFEGEVTVSAYGEDYEIGPGMMVTFPQGMDCVWDVKKAIRKAYKFG
ncbi:MAG TPA: cupin domain-containing protein [Clostridiales bacterium]|nr:cupin domain-containing protein [Clostridiales bacterium]